MDKGTTTHKAWVHKCKDCGDRMNTASRIGICTECEARQWEPEHLPGE